MPEELTPQVTTPTAPVTEPATAQQTMDSILKQASDIDARLQGNLPPVEEPATVTPEPETQPEIKPEAEVKPTVDVAAMLKEAGFGEQTLESVKDHIDKLKARDETWHWAAKNIPGFTQFVTKQMMINRGVEQPTEADTLSAFEQSLNKPKPAVAPVAPQPTPQDVYEIFKDRVNPVTGEAYDKSEIEAMVNDMKAINDKLGYVSKSEIESLRTEISGLKESKQVEKADEIWGKFPTNPIVAKQLEALGETWDGVMPHVARFLVTDIHISNPAQVTEKDLANAWNLYVMNNPGGLNKIISNAKTEAITGQEAKNNLPKPITPQGSTVAQGKTMSLADIMNDKSLSDAEKNKRITEFATLLDSRARR
jgi:hypothetical protein